MKAKYGMIVVAGSGKIGGHVASRNRAGAYFRTKVTPVNPKTSAQTTVRNRLSGISSGWRALTAPQRSAWNQAVVDFAKTDVFGDLRNPSGFNLYQRLNNNLVTCGESAITTPPPIVAVDAFTSITLTAKDATVAEEFSLAITPAVEADHLVKVYATAPMSAGVSFVSSEYRLIGIMPNSQASPWNGLASYQDVFGSTGEVGQKIFIKCVQVEENSGLEGTVISTSTLVVASS
jgi:hypothetical protein